MAGGGSTGQSSPKSSTATGPYSWQGATFGDTADTKGLSTQLVNNLAAEIKQGPQSIISSYTPLSQQTRGLIDTGLGQVAANRNSPLIDFASGKFLDGSNDPYFNANLATARDNTTRDVNSTFNNLGRFGADVHASGLAQGLDTAENQARSAQLTNEWNQMLGAQNALASNTATGLGYSNLLDQSNQAQTAAAREQQQATDPYNFLAKNWALLNGGAGANSQNTNQPTSLWDILGGVGSLIGSIA